MPDLETIETMWRSNPDGAGLMYVGKQVKTGGGKKRATNVVKIEKEVGAHFDPRGWADLSHRLIYLGREICHAQKPECEICQLNLTCPAGALIMRKRGTSPKMSGQEAVDELHAQGRGIPLTTAKR